MSDENDEKEEKNSNYLGIMFNCCNVYARIYKNKDGSAYTGRCPKCMKTVKISIGSGGTNQRFFRAY